MAAAIKITKWWQKILKIRRSKKVVVKEEPPQKVRGKVKKYIDAKGKTYDEVNPKNARGKKHSIGGKNPKTLLRGQTSALGSARGSKIGRDSVSNLSHNRDSSNTNGEPGSSCNVTNGMDSPS